MHRESLLQKESPRNEIPLLFTMAPQDEAAIPFRTRVGIRALDITGSLFGLLIGSPIMLAVAAAVKLTSRGPVLFKQNRIGKDGNLFPCLKFRTMIVDAEKFLEANPQLWVEFQKNYKLDNDPRITKIGNFLRKTSLDELPQLWNVLKGDMSLVGPRPIVPKEIAMYGECAEKLVQVRPGLTGLWQVSGRSETTYAERVQLDMDYIDQRSTRLNAKLIAKTFKAVILRKGAV